MEEKEVKKQRVYSHSRLWLYENCPEAYKIKYIDKTFPDLPKTVNLFLGGMVHEALEWLYGNIKEKNIELDELIKFYAETWNSKFSDEIIIGKGEEHYYFNQGIKYLIDYYKSNKPFDDGTIHIEKKIFFPLDSDKEYFIQGYVDRITFDPEKKEYEIHDYKTNQNMKTQYQVDSDRQLALYHLGLQDMVGKRISVSLIWHFLAHDRKISSRRTEEQLDSLKKETLALINKIENTTTWSACGRPWCDWCSYKRLNGLDYDGFRKIQIKKGNEDLGKFIGKD